ncbi:MAG: type II CAAX endopeptidase family protein [Eubacteriales bacterium]
MDLTTISNKKICFFLFLCFVAHFLIQAFVVLPLAFILSDINIGLQMIIIAFFYILVTTLSLKALVKKGFNLGLSDFRIDKPTLNLFAILSGVGLVSFVVLSYVFFVKGELVINSLSPLQTFNTFAQTFFFIGLGASITEEFVFRGVALGLVEKKWGIKAAIVLPNLIWAVLHILTSDFSDPIGILMRVGSISYVGIIFSIITIKTNTIWVAVFFHSIWNYTNTGIIYISTKEKAESPLNFVIESENLFITGGTFGIDGSVITMLGFSLLLVAYLLKYRNSVSHG